MKTAILFGTKHFDSTWILRIDFIPIEGIDYSIICIYFLDQF